MEENQRNLMKELQEICREFLETEPNPRREIQDLMAIALEDQAANLPRLPKELTPESLKKWLAMLDQDELWDGMMETLKNNPEAGLAELIVG